MAARNGSKTLVRMVDALVAVLDQKKQLDAEEKEMKANFKELGVGVYDGTDESIEVSERAGSTRLDEATLFVALTDELGLSVKKANEVLEKSKKKGEPTLSVGIAKRKKKV